MLLFLQVLSHELRTPLTPALMIAEAAELDPQLPESVRQDMRTIANNLKLEVQLIGDLLDVTKIRCDYSCLVRCHLTFFL